jgi:hypothetical protein
VVWRWFGGPGVVLREDAGTWVWFSPSPKRRSTAYVP